MISLAQIKLKANKLWETQSLQRDYISGENNFPFTISLPKLSANLLQQDFANIRTWIKELLSNSKEAIGYGYQIIFKDLKNRQLGSQTLPTRLLFSDLDDFLSFIDKKREYKQFCELLTHIIREQPSLKPWLYNHTYSVLPFKDKWTLLLKVCHFMQSNPFPQCYLRQLDLAGIDTKFIEQNKKILSELFEQLLPPESINQQINYRGAHYFEQRYGFKYDEQLIRFRILDKMNFQDLSIPLSQFQTLALPCRQVFITENKINGLSFPLIESAIVIFGLGYGIQALANIIWLKEKQIIYWGDIDTHGFAMLSLLRSYYPQTKSMLMDKITLEAFRHLWVQEPQDKRCTAELKHLEPEELALYQHLKADTWGKNLRLEQERISFNYFLNRLKPEVVLNPVEI